MTYNFAFKLLIQYAVNKSLIKRNGKKMASKAITKKVAKSHPEAQKLILMVYRRNKYLHYLRGRRVELKRELVKLFNLLKSDAFLNYSYHERIRVRAIYKRRKDQLALIPKRILETKRAIAALKHGEIPKRRTVRTKVCVPNKRL